MNRVEITNLNKKYPNFALENINFSIPNGYVKGKTLASIPFMLLAIAVIVPAFFGIYKNDIGILRFE